jgi:hypothetical protein
MSSASTACCASSSGARQRSADRRCARGAEPRSGSYLHACYAYYAPQAKFMHCTIKYIIIYLSVLAIRLAPEPLHAKGNGNSHWLP